MKLALVLFIACSAWAQQIAERVVSITQEPSHHLVFENKYVRVFNVEVAPHFATRVHRHDYDYIFVTLGDSDVSNEKLHAEPVELKLKDGETHFTSGGFSHKAVNLADTPFHNITIEFVEPGLTSSGAAANNGPIAAGHVNSLAANSQSYGRINLREGSFLNGEVSTCAAEHASGPQLLVPVSGFSLKTSASGNRFEKPGGVVWLNAGECATMTSRGDVPARFVIVNFPDENIQK